MIMDGKELARYVKVLTDSIHDGIFPKYFPEYNDRILGVTQDYFDGVKPTGKYDIPHRLDSLDNQSVLAKFRDLVSGPMIRLEQNITFPANMTYVRGLYEYRIGTSLSGEMFTIGSGTEEDMFQQSLVLDKWQYFTYEYLTEMNRLQAHDVQIYTERFFGFIMMHCDTLELMMMEEYGKA